MMHAVIELSQVTTVSALHTDQALLYSSGYWAPVVLLCAEQEILPKGCSHICKPGSKLRHRGVALKVFLDQQVNKTEAAVTHGDGGSLPMFNRNKPPSDV